MSSNFRYQTYVAVSGSIAGKVPVVYDVLLFHEQEICPTTSIDERWLEFEIQVDRNCYVDLRHTYLALKLKCVKCRGYETDSSKEVKEEYKKETSSDKETEEEEQEAPVSVVSHLNDILHAIFFIVEVYINNQQLYYSKCLYALKFYNSNSFKGAIFKDEGVLFCEGYNYEEFPDEFLEALLSEPFFTSRMKMVSRPGSFMLHGKLVVDFSFTSDMLYVKINIRLRLIRVRFSFYRISDNPNVSLGIVDCSLYTRRIALRDDYHQEKMDMLEYIPVEFNYMETLAKIFIIPARQNQFIQENFLDNAPVL